MTVNMIICAILTVLGLVFMTASLIGIAKLPDFFTRLHAQGVGDTIGAFLILAGMMAAAWGGLLPVKILLIFIVIVLTNPIGTNLMMIAAINKEDYLGYRTKMSGETKKDKSESQTENQTKEQFVSTSKKRKRKKSGDKSEDKSKDRDQTNTQEITQENKTDNKGRRNNRRRSPKPSMKMNKAELIKAAESRGIKVPDKATKREILDLIYNKQDRKTD